MKNRLLILIGMFMLAVLSSVIFGCGASTNGDATTTTTTSSTSTSTSSTTTSTGSLSWTVSAVGSIGDPGSSYSGDGFSSLAIDGSGIPHIGYIYFNTGYDTIIKHAFLSGSVWTTEVVDAAEGAGGGSLKLDSSGRPVMSYYGPDSQSHPWGDLRCAVRSGSSWTVEYVDYDTSPTYGYTITGKTSLALDGDDTAHIAYSTVDYGGTDSLKKATGSGSSWGAVVVDAQTYIGEAAIALDGDKHSHISYYDGSSLVKYAEWTGSGWTIRTVGSGMQNAIAADGAGRAHICYNDDSDQLVYAKWTGSTWESAVLATGLTTSGCSIVIDASGRPHIAYVDNAAKYVYWNGSSWVHETVEGNINCDYISIALDESGKPRISFADHYNHVLRYGARN